MPLWLGEQRAGVGSSWNLDVWRRLGWSPLRRECYPLGLGSRSLEVPPTPSAHPHGAETLTSEKRVLSPWAELQEFRGAPPPSAPTSHGAETPTSEKGVLSPWAGLQEFRGPPPPAPTPYGAETLTSEKGAPSSGCVRLGCGNGSRNQKQLPQIKGASPSPPASGSPPRTFHSQDLGAAWKRRSCDVQSPRPVEYGKENTELRDTSLVASTVK